MKKMAADHQPRGKRRTSGIGSLGIATCVVCALLATSIAGFWVHVRRHEATVRAGKQEEYAVSEARIASEMCVNKDRMSELKMGATCIAAHNVLRVPFEEAVQEEAWDNALQSIYAKATGFSGAVVACMSIAVIVGILSQCVWCALRLPRGGVLPGAGTLE